MSSIQDNITGKEFRAKADLRVGIVQSTYNAEIGDPMQKECMDTLLQAGVEQENIISIHVPGAFELPIACQKMAQKDKPDVIIALGVIIQGETPHFDFIASACAQGIMDLSLKIDTPIVFGVLTTDNLDQAKARINKGVEAAHTALQINNLNL